MTSWTQRVGSILSGWGRFGFPFRERASGSQRGNDRGGGFGANELVLSFLSSTGGIAGRTPIVACPLSVYPSVYTYTPRSTVLLLRRKNMYCRESVSYITIILLGVYGARGLGHGDLTWLGHGGFVC